MQVVVCIYATVSDHCEPMLKFHLLQNFCRARKKQRQRMIKFQKKHFSLSSVKAQPWKQWKRLGVSVWIGRLDKEGGGQSEAVWTHNERSPAGVIGWSGAPQGSFRSLSLLFSCSPSSTRWLFLWLAPLPFGALGSLWVPGEQNCGVSRCGGPIGTAKVLQI